MPLQLPSSVLESDLPTDPMGGWWPIPLQLSKAMPQTAIVVSSITEGRSVSRWSRALGIGIPVLDSRNESPPGRAALDELESSESGHSFSLLGLSPGGSSSLTGAIGAMGRRRRTLRTRRNFSMPLTVRLTRPPGTAVSSSELLSVRSGYPELDVSSTSSLIPLVDRSPHVTLAL